MQLSNAARILGTIFALGLILSGAISCGDADEVEPTDVFLSATPTEVFESPLAVPEATLPPLTVEEGSGGVKGVLVALPSEWEGMELTVYFAPFYPGEGEEEGIYILEPSIHSSVQVHASGAFQLGDIAPGRYVVVVGPTPEEAWVLRDGDQPRIIEITQGSILELSDLRLE
jgi:hypothetical protein